MKTHHYSVVLEPQPDGGFTALVPALPEIVTEGDSEAEALNMVADAIELALAHRRDSGIEIPPDQPPHIRIVSVAAE